MTGLWTALGIASMNFGIACSSLCTALFQLILWHASLVHDESVALKPPKLPSETSHSGLPLKNPKENRYELVSKETEPSVAEELTAKQLQQKHMILRASTRHQAFVLSSLLVFGAAFQVASYSCAPQSFLIPFTAMGILWAMLFSKVFALSVIESHHIFSCVLTLSGCIVVVCAAASDSHSSSPRWDWQSTQTVLQSPGVMGYALALLVVVVVMSVWISCFPSHEAVSRVFYLVRPGLVVGNVFLVKALVIMLASRDWFLEWTSYLFILCLFLWQLGGLWLLRTSMSALQDYLCLMPVHQGIIILLGTLSGMLVFRETQNMSTSRLIILWVGICLTLLGLSSFLTTVRHALARVLMNSFPDLARSIQGSPNFELFPEMHISQTELDFIAKSFGSRPLNISKSTPASSQDLALVAAANAMEDTSLSDDIELSSTDRRLAEARALGLQQNKEAFSIGSKENLGEDDDEGF